MLTSNRLDLMSENSKCPIWRRVNATELGISSVGESNKSMQRSKLLRRQSIYTVMTCGSEGKDCNRKHCSLVVQQPDDSKAEVDGLQWNVIQHVVLERKLFPSGSKVTRGQRNDWFPNIICLVVQVLNQGSVFIAGPHARCTDTRLNLPL